MKCSVFSQVHLAHPALADLRADFVATEFGVGSNGHSFMPTLERRDVFKNGTFYL
jgi:hypothetical protein